MRRLKPIRSVKFLEQRARELGVVVHNQDVGDPVARAGCHLEQDPCGVRRSVGRARWHRMDLAGEVVDVHLHLVEARLRHGEAKQPVDPDHAVPARGKREGMEQATVTRAHVVGLGALADRISHVRT